MKVSKTVQAGVVELTNKKRKELETEYENFQKYLQREEDVELYSAIKQDATRYYDNIKEDKEYPISVRGQQIESKSVSQI